MTKRVRIAIGSAAALVLAVGGGLAIGLPALADSAPTPSSTTVEDGTNDGETADDGAVEDGTADGESDDDGAVEDGTNDGESDDDGVEDGTADGETDDD